MISARGGCIYFYWAGLSLGPLDAGSLGARFTPSGQDPLLASCGVEESREAKTDSQ